MKIFALQGDQIIRKLDRGIAGNLESATNLVIAGSHSSPHTIRGNVLMRMDGDVLLVRVELDTTIEHAGRHQNTVLPAGDYEIFSQRERGGNGDHAVED
jgi:hypothetical protein